MGTPANILSWKLTVARGRDATNHCGRQQAVTIDNAHQLSVLGLGAKRFLPPGECTSETPQTRSH